MIELVRNFPYLGRKEIPVALILEREAKLTAKGQVTIPKPIRDALGVEDGDSIVYRVNDDGSVNMSRADGPEDEAAIDAFLRFLSDDIKRRPEALVPLSQEEVDRWAVLVEGVEADIDDDFSGASPL